MKKLTKRERRILQSYKESNNYNLGDVYGRISDIKYEIYNKHFNEFTQDQTATGFRIISFNNFMFTLGYKTIKNGITYLRYISKSKDELIIFED